MTYKFSPSKVGGVAVILLLPLTLGCAVIEQTDIQMKLAQYNCYYGCLNETTGEMGWCCEHEVSDIDHYIFDCKNAKERKIIQ